MLIISAVFLALLAVATPAPGPYGNNVVPMGFIPVYNPPYNNFVNSSRNQSYGCMPHDYDLPGSHSGFYGCKKIGDKLLFTENIFKPNKFFSTREKFIEFPGEVPKGHVRNELITAIWCYDVSGYGKGGYCSIMEGGIGKKYVKMHIYQTERNVPLRYKIEIYGNTTILRK